MPTSYQPIACALHDEFEIAIMRQEMISILWRDENDVPLQATVVASDIVVKNKEEFVIFNIHGINALEINAQKVNGMATNDRTGKTADLTKCCIRLDRIALLAR